MLKPRSDGAAARSGCVICVDGGTTRTRAIALVKGRVVATVRVAVGARDTARSGARRALARGVRRAIALAARAAGRRGGGAPELIVAAGMIGSAEGLHEVAHVAAPAGARELAAGADRRRFRGVAAAPILFVPGVRSGPARVNLATVAAADVMRGEETIALGLATGRRGPLRGGGWLVSLGSHWKAIRVDARGRIAGSTSALSGELMAAIAAETILASALPAVPPEHADQRFVTAGGRICAQHGLARALYAVRLLAQRGPGDAEARQSFMLGAMIEASWPVLERVIASRAPIVLTGAPAVATAVGRRLRAAKRLRVQVLSSVAAEAAFVAGCVAVAHEWRRRGSRESA